MCLVPAKVLDSMVNYTVVVGQSVDLECIAEGDIPLSVAWSSARDSIDPPYSDR